MTAGIGAVLLVAACILLLPSSAPQAATGNIGLVGQLPLPGADRNSDIWSWVDPNTSKEYAAIGKWPSVGGTVHIVDVSNPTNPTLVKTLSGVPSFDVKTYGTYLYLCDGNASGGNDSQIWSVADPLNPVLVGNFPTCHNITIDDNGFLYLSFSTLRIYNLNPDPATPTFVWTDNLAGGHDASIIGNRLYDFHGSSGTFIYDISALPAAPTLLGAINPPDIVYHHSGWTSLGDQYLFINDELGGPGTADFTAWDISNPATPVKVDSITDPNATIHNSFRIGTTLFTSFYVAGFRVYDITDPTNIALSDEYDTSVFTGNGVYAGAWGVYPFSPSGNIFVSDMQNGLYIFSFTPTPTGIRDDMPSQFALEQNFPNPFNPTTTISYNLAEAGHVRLAVYNVTGKQVRVLRDGHQSQGLQSATWNARDDSGRPVSSGVYFYRLETGGSSETKRMTLLK
jgi:choice-of-anchor B domain-containing protein